MTQEFDSSNGLAFMPLSKQIFKTDREGDIHIEHKHACMMHTQVNEGTMFAFIYYTYSNLFAAKQKPT